MIDVRRLRHKLKKSVVEKGLLATAKAVIRKGLDRTPGPASVEPKEYATVHPFDQQHGVETSGLLFPENLASGKKKDLYNAGYFGVAPSAFQPILGRLAVDFNRFTFVDVGSGKGRALMIASEYPFRAIVGVELSPVLHSTAVSNIARYRGSAQLCANICAIEADATEFDFPSGPLLVYLWNPFELPVFTRFLANLESSLASDSRETYVLYIQPDVEHVLEASHRWQLLWREEFLLSEEDYAAHAFPSRVEICSAYKLVR